MPGSFESCVTNNHSGVLLSPYFHICGIFFFFSNFFFMPRSCSLCFFCGEVGGGGGVDRA